MKNSKITSILVIMLMATTIFTMAPTFNAKFQTLDNDFDEAVDNDYLDLSPTNFQLQSGDLYVDGDAAVADQPAGVSTFLEGVGTLSFSWGINAPVNDDTYFQLIIYNFDESGNFYSDYIQGDTSEEITLDIAKGGQHPVQWIFRMGDGETGSVFIDNIQFGGYILLTDVVGSGSLAVSPDKSNYHYSEEVTLTATADPGWEFTHWTGDASGNTNPLTVSMTTDKSITANFDQTLKHTLIVDLKGKAEATVEIENQEPVTIEQDQSFQVGDGKSVTISSNSPSNWDFLGYTVIPSSNEDVENGNQLTITMTEDREVRVCYNAQVEVTGLEDEVKAKMGDTVSFSVTANPTIPGVTDVEVVYLWVVIKDSEMIYLELDPAPPVENTYLLNLDYQGLSMDISSGNTDDYNFVDAGELSAFSYEFDSKGTYSVCCEAFVKGTNSCDVASCTVQVTKSGRTITLENNPLLYRFINLPIFKHFPMLSRLLNL